MIRLRSYLNSYLAACVEDACPAGCQSPAGISVADQEPPHNEILPPYDTRRAKVLRQSNKKFRKSLANVIREAEESIFMDLWNMHGAFWMEFHPMVDDVESEEDFATKLIDLNFHPDTDLPEFPEKHEYANVEKEIELLKKVLQHEPVSGLLAGHGWPAKFEENIRAGRRMSSGCGFKWGDHEPTDFISEAISWQALLDDAPMCTLDGRQVLIKNLIYSAEQAAGLLKDGDALLPCVWNSEGKCIQKRTEDETRDLEISDNDTLKIRL